MEAMQIVKTYMEGFECGDMDAVRSVLADDFSFQGPMMSTSGGAGPFIDGMCAFGEFRMQHNMINASEHEGGVALLYDCVFTKPFEATIRMSEWFEFSGEKIKSIQLVFDTALMPSPEG